MTNTITSQNIDLSSWTTLYCERRSGRHVQGIVCRDQLKCDGTRAETRFLLSAKRASPFKSVGSSVQSTTGSQGVRISGSNAGTPCSEVVWRVLATHSIRHFPLHFPSHASPYAITFQLESTTTHSSGLLLSIYACFKTDDSHCDPMVPAVPLHMRSS